MTRPAPLPDARPHRRTLSPFRGNRPIFATAIAALLTAAPTAALAQGVDIAPPPSGAVPLPEPFERPQFNDPDNPLAMPEATPSMTAEPVIGGAVEDLPPAVRKTRETIMQAARNADIEALRPLIEADGETTQLTFGDLDGDPIDFLRSLSGDAEGHEILAILLEVLEAGYAIFDPGTSNEIYVWPYFTATSLDDLTPKQRIELFKLVTSGDYEEMRAFGAYIFFRAGITPDGKWRFFVAGD
ncbi:hypothetical protein [Oricola thermophila]|uniref:Uncharacterized protein n=1 Tax=Oricola thermophila TaxID=2742145 RepID=A0A6N1VHI0_9HYPH|nr:hypothetical protein [Oricola thermophila]QKV18457.1 hypothetical protein HTY61_08330 [Oricola thermophila]